MFSLSQLTAALVIAFLLHRILRASSRPPLPPGPPKRFLIGNLLDIPTRFDWKTYGAWADKWGALHYSPLISVSAFGTHIISVNTLKKSNELLEGKSAIYSSRPHVPMPVDLMGWENAMAFTPYGPRFKAYRKTFHEELGNPAALRKFWPQEEIHARKFLELCYKSPTELERHCFHHAGAIILRVAYGYEALENDDPMVKVGNEAMDTFNKGCAPGSFMVNQIPALKYVPEWFPGAGFQTTARLWRHWYGDMVNTPFDFVKKSLANGTAEDSFVAIWLKKKLSPFEEDALKHAAGSMFGGGGETTAVTVYMFFLLMAQHPEIQKKAQAEVDEVCGHRLPTLEDRAEMPYVNALAKEVLRSHPAVPTGLPHCTTEDDVHDGYFIPKGSIVSFNIWKMCRDPAVYSNPEMFNPERFLGESPEMDPEAVVFGFGRRICPGRLLADVSVFITLAMSLAAFNIQPVVEGGKPAPPVYASEGGPVDRLVSFKCSITPRYDPDTMATLFKEH
ncbi:cytochrome P450 [Cylindrobasidium torrendii FP15055 ss-10]|uniref:Cytochrome P450 n=1 Tax=Cylindrobasidium torrendii FP15055 ss-10 TaxID=1314674 RepID=A0A0D7AUM5_9AGAR|nr:cytochrome P450 [Cylindrobasidium torrendii FP15055 ss-10]